MTATQAPTPGPLTAAIDMLSDARDFIDRFSDVIDGDYGTSEPNAAMVMVHEINATIDHLSAPTAPVEASGSERFQDRCGVWLDVCFGPESRLNVEHRNARFLEEAVELVQASGMTETAATDVVRYAFGRPQGEINQEVGGVMMTLAAHCLATGVDMTAEGERELARVWTKVDQIRAKEAAKPSFSTRPQPSGETRPTDEEIRSAIKATEYKYFGDYEFSEEQHAAVDVLVRAAQALLSAERLSTTPARAKAQDEGAAGEWPEKWSGDCTVGNMIANLRTLPPEMPLYTAYHIPMDGEPSLLRVKRPTMSRERVDGITIKTGDKSVPYSAVIWTQPQDPLEAHPSPTPAADAEALLPEVMTEEMERVWRGAFIYQGHKRHGRGAIGNSRRLKNPESCEQYAWRALRKHLLAALKSEGK